MRFPIALLLLALGHAIPADASIVKRATDRFHSVALKHSAGLARDIRTVLNGFIVESPKGQVRIGVNQKPYCVSKSSTSGGSNASSGNGTSNANSPSSGSSSARPSSTSTSSGASPSAKLSSNWKVAKSYSGNNFFSGWDFFTGGDPTNGIITYVDQNTAQSNNLTSINSAGNAIMGVDTTAQVSGNNRKSVRITTEYAFTGGLVIMDSVHMPTGCGTWPAFWTNGPNWPAGGEIDIVEGVNDYTNNQATIHTNHGCTLSSSNATALGFSGTIVGGTNCAALETGNAGCGVRAVQTNSFGAAFNNIGGGVYTMLWDNNGVSVWFFPRSSIPSDITAGAPQPANWGVPMARWASSSCNSSTFFSDHSAIFDTTLCGDWASGVWSSTGVPGQDQSCAQRTGVSTCEAFVQNNGAAFQQAYWEVKSVNIYQNSS
ncbi:hypothetical protein EW146_g9746 [Bondarzewia mesenterica]|uniref:GH16 domain-containing protein n=1 Tax=Bondarzewia mesenterica TaxID=1095465 RepID=A0A4S4L3V4_9AGAM|nr:hypothetical protein EW146_g9746 [Bondarzewia mesenterica]